MKRKVLAALMCTAMVATLLSGCGGQTGGTEVSEKESASSEKESQTDSGTQEVELSVKPVVYYPFESADEGWKVVVGDTAKASNNAYDISLLDSAAARSIVYGDMSLAQLKDEGVSGKSIFMNRDYALDLNLTPTKTSEYTISYWICAAGIADFAPTLQFGSNIGCAADAGNQVAWVNFTSAFSQQYPVVWSRNEVFDGPTGVDCWPWMYQVGDPALRGYKEWAMITLVVTGEEQQSPIADGGKTVGAKLYVNGELKYDSQDNYMNGTYFEYTWDCSLAPDLMNPTETQKFESYFGINYWDTMYKGYLDEFYVFDKAISESDVKALYALGDPSNPPEVSSADDPKENAPELPDANSIQAVGKNDYTQGWWTTFSDIHEVKAGETKTFTFKNYHTNLSYANWNNGAVILQNTSKGHSVTGTENGIDPVDGYKEYAVVRLDNFGWGSGYDNKAVPECDWNWDAFKDATHGATVECAITNHGTTADIVMTITALDGTVYHQSYKNIAVDGDVYACFTVEKAWIDIIDIK